MMAIGTANEDIGSHALLSAPTQLLLKPSHDPQYVNSTMCPCLHEVEQLVALKSEE